MSGNPTVNAGTVENKGFEISLNHRNNVGDLYYQDVYKRQVSYTSALTAVPMWNVYGEDGTWGVAPEWTRCV